MPRIETEDRDAEVEAQLTAWESFIDGRQWKQSVKGNWWRQWQGLTLTVYLNKFGRWQHCVADPDGPHWSPNAYDSEDEAMESLFYELTGGD